MNTSLKIAIIVVMFPAPVFADFDKDVAKLENILNKCVLNNRSTVMEVKNCAEEGEKALNESKYRDNLIWIYAELVRRKLGNTPSLPYFQKALANKTTPERCIHDGLDTAVKMGLQLPENFTDEIQAVKAIVFNLCWEWYKEEILILTQRSQSSYWMDNVCVELKQKAVNVPETCELN